MTALGLIALALLLVQNIYVVLCAGAICVCKVTCVRDENGNGGVKRKIAGFKIYRRGAPNRKYVFEQGNLLTC